MAADPVLISGGVERQVAREPVTVVRGVGFGAVTVVDETVPADLGRAGVSGVVSVVAVGALRGVAAGRRAALHRLLRNAVAVEVCISVVGGGDALVDLVVAVVVDPVAALGNLRAEARAGCRGVITVSAALDVASRGRTALGDLRIVAVAIAVEVEVVGDLDVFVDLAVAVVVDPVAQLLCAGVDGVVVVIAVIRQQVSVAVTVLTERSRLSGIDRLFSVLVSTGHQQHRDQQTHRVLLSSGCSIAPEASRRKCPDALRPRSTSQNTAIWPHLVGFTASTRAAAGSSSDRCSVAPMG